VSDAPVNGRSRRPEAARAIAHRNLIAVYGRVDIQGSNHTMDWKAFQRLKVRNFPAWSLDLLFIPAGLLAIEWLWFVNKEPVLAIVAGVLVLGVRELAHYLHARPGRRPEDE
jgi:hypothetical protein